MQSPILRDFMRFHPNWVPTEESLETLLNFVTCQGVKIGGQYKHFRGDVYRVVGLVRDSDDWDGEVLVEYVAVHNANHVATRKLSEFLGDVDKPEYRGPRFRLLEVV